MRVSAFGVLDKGGDDVVHGAGLSESIFLVLGLRVLEGLPTRGILKEASTVR